MEIVAISKLNWIRVSSTSIWCNVFIRVFVKINKINGHRWWWIGTQIDFCTVYIDGSWLKRSGGNINFGTHRQHLFTIDLKNFMFTNRRQCCVHQKIVYILRWHTIAKCRTLEFVCMNKMRKTIWHNCIT